MTITTQPLASTNPQVVTDDGNTATVTVLLSTITDALNWTIPAAAKDHALEAITGIQFTVGVPASHPGHYDLGWNRVLPTATALTLAATDRHRLHWATVPVAEAAGTPDPTVGFQFIVGAADLASAMKSWPKVPARGVPLMATATFSFDRACSRVDIRANYLHVTATASYRTVEGTFPNVGPLVPWAWSDCAAEGIGLSATYLGSLTAAALKSGSKSSPLRFRLNGPAKPLAVSASTTEDLVQRSALLMPVRLAK